MEGTSNRNIQPNRLIIAWDVWLAFELTMFVSPCLKLITCGCTCIPVLVFILRVEPSTFQFELQHFIH